MRASIKSLVVVWIIVIAVLLNGCPHTQDRRRNMLDLNMQDLRNRNVSINLVQYRNLHEDEPTREADWKIVIFAEEVGFEKDDIVLVEKSFYIPDGDRLIHICEVSDQQATDQRVIPYLKRNINRTTLLE